MKSLSDELDADADLELKPGNAEPGHTLVPPTITHGVRRRLLDSEERTGGRAGPRRETENYSD